MAGQFRYTVWDPWMIISQIVTLQCIFYVSLGLWVFTFDLCVGTPRSLDQIFKYQVKAGFLGNHASTSTLTFLQELHATKASGKLLIGAFIVNALIW